MGASSQSSSEAEPARPGAIGWRALAIFLTVLGGLNLAYYAEKKLALGIWDGPYTRFVAWVSGAVAQVVLPYRVEVSGKALVVEQMHAVFIASGCNGLEAIFLMVAGIVAFPASWGQRWRGLALYLPLLFVLNVVRVVALTHVAYAYPQHMDFAHRQVGQGALIVFVLFFWVRYIRSVR